MSLTVCLVIPARNAARTLRPCLTAAVAILEQGQLARIIVVDDGSTDETATIAAEFPVQCVQGRGAGPAAARNLGWRAVHEEIVWFIDSDCVAESDALERLLPHLNDTRVAGAGGSYGNMCPDSLLSCLIHEEIVARHERMANRVDYLATFNVIYRRSVLEQTGGFDERLRTASCEDAELAWRILAAGHQLAFDQNSRVKHFHPARLRPYLRTQMRHGYYRVHLYLAHPRHARGDAYSGIVDHVQPPLAVLLLASLPTLTWPQTRIVAPALTLLLGLAQIPYTARLVRRTRSWRYLAYAPMSFVRAFARGIGMTAGVAAYLASRVKRNKGRAESPAGPP